MSLQLSTDQINAVNGICDILLDAPEDAHAIAVLTGSAGTGKTTVVKEIIRKLNINTSSRGHEIHLAASTHRAADVLQDIVRVAVTTAHSLFKLQPSVSQYGKEIIKSSGRCKIAPNAIIIMDESSMLGNKFLQAINEIVQERHIKILFVGDPFQLPPPTDTCSIFDGSLPTFTLTQVHRQADGNPILKKANEYREYIEGTRQDEPTLITELNTKGEGIHVLPHAEFITKFVAKYVNYAPGQEVDIPLCTFTNESAINYNSMIRKATYFLGDTIEPFYKGEQLIANSAVIVDDRILLNNNEVVTVQAFTDAEFEGIPGHNVTVKGDMMPHTRNNLKTVFVPISKHAADKVLNEHKKHAIKSKSKSEWVSFYNVKNALADLRPPFAGTTHKAQGGTFPAVFIDRMNINKCKDAWTRARLLYVALTRASEHVYINA